MDRLHVEEDIVEPHPLDRMKDRAASLSLKDVIEVKSSTFSEIIVSPFMLVDHKPANYLDVLATAAGLVFHAEEEAKLAAALEQDVEKEEQGDA